MTCVCVWWCVVCVRVPPPNSHAHPESAALHSSVEGTVLGSFALLLFGAKGTGAHLASFWAARAQDLLKNTDESHVDYDDLSKALKMTQEVADYLNERYSTPFHAHTTHTTHA